MFSISIQVLEEVSAAQLNMCNSLEATLGTALATFAQTELSAIAIMKKETDEATQSAEQLFCKYLTSGKQQTVVDNHDGQSKPPGKQGIASRVTNWSKKTLAGELDRRRIARVDSAGASPEDATLGKAMTAASLKATMQQIRLAQASAELKRFQLVKRLINAKVRRNFEVGEDVMATFHALNAYYHQCADLVAGYIPGINRIQAKQNETHVRHTKYNQPYWNDHEHKLEVVAENIQDSLADAVRVADRIGEGDPVLIDQQLLNREDIEENIKFWLLPAELALNSGCKREPTPGVLIEGWLYKKSAAMISLTPWSRRWFVMDRNAIYYYRTDAETRRANGGGAAAGAYSERVKVGDVVLCSVRELPNDGAGSRFCFQLVTPSDKPLTLQARGPLEYKMWVEGIRANTTRQLVQGNHHSAGTKDRRQILDNDSRHSTSDYSDSQSEQDALYESSTDFLARNNPIVQDIMEANPICADCSMPHPDWASINLCVLICIQCSAVHRSLGVHVSKVRSLKLDSLGSGEARLLLSLGNEKVNEIWEAGLKLQKGWHKPTATAERKDRENWIKSKYMYRGFVNVDESDGLDAKERMVKYSHDLYAAAKSGDLMGVMTSFAKGGSIDWVNPDEDGKTPLHICALCKARDANGTWQAIETAEFLLQNGAKLDALDGFAHGVLDCALLGNADVEMVEYLTSKLA